MVRMIVATHSATPTPASIGMTRNGLVYEIFLTIASPQAFTPADVLHLYLHRGSFENVLATEDQEQDPDRLSFLTRLVGRNSGRSCPNGSGISA